MTETGPEERRRYLDAIAPDTATGGGIGAEVARAERLLERTAADWDAASRERQCARADSPDHDLAHDRELNPAERSAVVRTYVAEEAWTRSESAYLAARARLDRLIKIFDGVRLDADLGLLSEEQ